MQLGKYTTLSNRQPEGQHGRIPGYMRRDF